MMKSLVTIALIGCISSSAIPVAASETAVVSDWARLGQLAPGTEIVATTTTPQTLRRRFLAANETGLTVLNLTDSVLLPRSVQAVLRDAASNHPRYLLDAQEGGVFELEQHVRLEPNGVFVFNAQVATWDQIVEVIARPQVAELRRASLGGHRIARDVGIGTAMGLGTGLLWGLTGGGSEAGFWTLVGTVIGAGLGAVGGLAAGIVDAATHDDLDRLVYRAGPS